MREVLTPPRGRLRTYTIDGLAQELARRDGMPLWHNSARKPYGWQAASPWQSNAVLFEWGAIVINCLLRKGLNYGIGGMYVEFENVASPGDTVTPPDFTRGPSEGIDYYRGLADSSNRDYLRVPLIAGTLSTTDQEQFPLGNQGTFFAQTSGVQGVHGKEWSDAVNSVAFGAALVAFVDEDDASQDIVYARAYLSIDAQQPKLATSQIGFEWSHVYG